MRLNLSREHHADAAPTGDDNRTRFAFFMPKAGHSAIEMRTVTDKIDAVANLHSIRTRARQNHRTITNNRQYGERQIRKQACQMTQWCPHGWAVSRA